MEVYSEIVPFNTPLSEILEKKPKGIIQALKEEPYEPKVGDMFEHEHFEKSLKIIRIVEDLIVMKDYSEILNFCCLSTCDFLNELKNGNLKKIN